MAVKLEKVDYLNHLITDEFLKALSLKPDGRFRKYIAPLVRRPTWKFSNIAANFDNLIDQEGFGTAATWLMNHFTDDVKFHGKERIPQSGPLLLISNHPGVIDGLVISSNLPRDDVKIIMSGVPFVRNLENTSEHMIFTTLDTYDRMSTARASIKHLRSEKSLLIFATGKLDPDPSFRSVEDASSALERWSQSVALMIKRVPNIQVVISIVGGVLAEKFFHHPLTRVRKTPHDRQRISEFMQVTRQLLMSKPLGLHSKVSFSHPLTAKEFPSNMDKASIMETLIEEAKNLLQEHVTREANAWTSMQLQEHVSR